MQVISLLIGGNANANCVHGIRDLLKYFETGQMPGGPSSTEPTTLEDFYADVTSTVVKRENGKKYREIIESTVNLEKTQFPHIPYGKEILELPDGTQVVDNDVSTLDSHKQLNACVTEINDILKREATRNNSDVSFGVISLGHCSKFYKLPGHILMYFANADRVWYIDVQPEIQNIKGCSKKAEHIFANLTDGYKFVGKDAIDENTFGKTVFYIPIGPRLIPDATLVTVKQEILEPQNTVQNLNF